MDLSTVNFRNVSYTATERMLACEIEHPEYGWIHFNASLDDVEDMVLLSTTVSKKQLKQEQ